MLYINQGNGTFREHINDHLKHQSYNAMGVDIADINNDGLADIVTLDMLPYDNYRKKMMAGSTQGTSVTAWNRSSATPLSSFATRSN